MPVGRTEDRLASPRGDGPRKLGGGRAGAPDRQALVGCAEGDVFGALGLVRCYTAKRLLTATLPRI